MVYIVNRVIDVLNLLGYRCLEPYQLFARDSFVKCLASQLLAYSKVEQVVAFHR